MKALILNGGTAESAALDVIQATLMEDLRHWGWEVGAVELREVRIAWCTGCFECWTKTPGICKTRDAGRDVARAMIASDLTVLLTPVTFGGYSSELKKALDRAIGLLSPFFTRIEGEVHHRARYDRYPALLAVGWLAEPDEEEERIFRTLVRRNALNMHAPAWACGVVHRGEDPREVRTLIRPVVEAVGRAA